MSFLSVENLHVSYKREDKNFIENKSGKGNILKCLVQKSLNENVDNNIIDSLDDVNVAESTKIKIRDIFNDKSVDNAEISSVIFDIINGMNILETHKGENLDIWNNNIKKDIYSIYNELDDKYLLETMNLFFMHAINHRLFNYSVYNDWKNNFYKIGDYYD